MILRIWINLNEHVYSFDSAKASNTNRIQTLQSIILGKITKFPFYVANYTLHKYINVPFVLDYGVTAYHRIVILPPITKDSDMYIYHCCWVSRMIWLWVLFLFQMNSFVRQWFFTHFISIHSVCKRSEWLRFCL
jgi:hypothetical protein